MPTTKIRIIASTDSTANSVKVPRPRSHGCIRSHFGVPQASSPSTIGTVKEMKMKMTVQETTIA